MTLNFKDALGTYYSQHIDGQLTWNYAIDDHRIIDEGFRVRLLTIHPTAPENHQRWILAEGVKTLKEAKKIAQDHYDENKGEL